MSFAGAQQFDPTFKGNDWEKYYLWWPKKINGKWYWRTTVYRRYVLSPGGGFWEYGDDFDVIKHV